MIEKLYISNYALIQESEINPEKGLNVLLGETGAGKSLLLGAIGLILGNRIDHKMVFDKDRKCIVEATFNNIPPSIYKELLAFEEFDMEEESLSIRREVSPGGKSRSFINDTPVTLETLRKTTDLLLDIHLQNDNQNISDEKWQLLSLDKFAGLEDKTRTYNDLFNQQKKVSKEIQDLQSRKAKAKQETDFYQFQFDELEKADLNDEEEEKIEKRLKILENSENWSQAFSQSSKKLYSEENSLYEQLSLIVKSLESAQDFSDEIKPLISELSNSIELFHEASNTMDSFLSQLEFDPREYEILNDRFDLLNRLKMKFSVSSVSELIQLKQEFEDKMTLTEHLDDEIKRLEENEQEFISKLKELGLTIEQKRQKAATTLSKNITILLGKLSFEEAVFQIELSRSPSPDGPIQIEGTNYNSFSNGINKLEFRVKTNKGTETGLLSKVASGGEKSRIMLALKSALAEKSSLPVMIFDEIDAGIGGTAAHQVGKLLRKLAQKHQIITITHLPQIAAAGDTHFKIHKVDKDDKTISQVKKLIDAEIVREIATMIGGFPPSELSIKNSEELIRNYSINV